MASNFKILVHKDSDCIHIKLWGDFDGTSACELLNLIKANGNKIGKIVINTDGLKRVHPFGRDVFLNNFSGNQTPCNLLFTGRARDELAPGANGI